MKLWQQEQQEKKGSGSKKEEKIKSRRAWNVKCERGKEGGESTEKGEC